MCQNLNLIAENCEGNHKIACADSQHKSKVAQKKLVSTMVYIKFRGGGGVKVSTLNFLITFTITVYLLT